MKSAMRSALLILLAPAAFAATTIATIGDSLADGIYLGMKLQPDMLKANDIRLIRWSRSNVGLTRTDQTDYAAWIRDTADLGSADFCLVHMGANDLQGIPAGNNKWLSVGTDAWQKAYAERVKTFVEMLKAERCKSVIWLLQAAYEKNKYLSQYRGMLNSLQFGSSAAAVAATFDLATSENDYGADGIHFSQTFYFSVARAVIHLFDAWKPFASPVCSACHPAAKYFPAGAGEPLIQHSGQ